MAGLIFRAEAKPFSRDGRGGGDAGGRMMTVSTRKSAIDAARCRRLDSLAGGHDMSERFSKAAIRTRAVQSTAEREILIALAEQANDEGLGALGWDQIAEEAGMPRKSRRRVNDHYSHDHIYV
jgi:hypothetical protein